MIMPEHKKLGGEFGRFLLVGGVSTAFNYLVFYVLLQAGMHYQAASACGFLSGVAVGFWFNKNWTYQRREKAENSLYIRYLAVYVTSLALSLVVLHSLVDEAGLAAWLANIIVIGITTFTNFIGTKFWVFRV